MSVDKLAQKLISWISDTVSAAGGKGVVVGLSGGLDSSVAAVLCRHAFPGAILGLILPCHSDKSDREHAELVADRFNLPVKVVVLDEVFNALVKLLPGEG
ncbi:MAG: NAD(+) synthetase, partial [Dehalococcoidia bacterium]